MRIEAFSQARDPDQPAANEDRFVILPGRAYAVIDGVSSRTPARHDGMLSGAYAAALVQRVVEREATGQTDGRQLVRTLTAAISEDYRARNMWQAVRDEVNLRFAATLALVLDRDGGIEITLVGDSGVRLNCKVVHRVEKDIDGITATLRQAAWRLVAGRSDEPAVREQASRQVVRHGTRQPVLGVRDWFDEADMRAIEAAAEAACAGTYPALDASMMDELLHGGILNAQKRHQNNADSPLGYSCLDGFAVPDAFITTVTLPRDAVRTIELFSDGYFAPGHGFGIDAWEARFAEIERIDPTKTGQFPSVKGSLGRLASDDRTYVGVSMD